MNFAGMIKQSLVDYPGKIATVLFTQGCNFACPFCHNSHLLYNPGKTGIDFISMDKILDFLQERVGFIDAVVISGGEPTLHRELPEALNEIKNVGYLTKLDTNGTNNSMLAEILSRFLIDYVAMDVKSVLDIKKYQQATGGRMTAEAFLNVKGSINILKQADVDVEFRTTVVPELHTAEDIINIARYLEGARLYSLQQFNPRYTLNASYQSVVPFTKSELADIAEVCRQYVQEVRVLNI